MKKAEGNSRWKTIHYIDYGFPCFFYTKVKSPPENLETNTTLSFNSLDYFYILSFFSYYTIQG